MYTAIATILVLAAFSSSLCALAVHLNVDEGDLSLLDDREAREEATDFNGNWDFRDSVVKQNDDDLYFSQNYDNGMEKRKSVDYEEWNKMDRFALDDEKAEVQEEEEKKEEEKGIIKKLIQKFKNLLHRIGKRR